MSDKIIEILTQKISIQMAMQQYDQGLQSIQKRNQLAQQIFGLESEQYCEFLEEEVILTY